jgi:hypothetical protein
MLAEVLKKKDEVKKTMERVNNVSRFRVQSSAFRVQGSTFRVQSSAFRVQGSTFRVYSSRFKVQRALSTERVSTEKMRYKSTGRQGDGATRRM